MARESTFDPEKLGLVTLVNKRGSNGGGCCDYLIYTKETKQSDGSTRTQLKLSLCDRTGRLVSDLIGNRCAVSIDPQSKDIYLWAGDEFAISECGGKKPGTKKRKSISLKSLLPMYLDSFGEARKVMYEAESQYGGSVVKLTMKEER